MKRRRGTVEGWALAAGLPAAKARRAVNYEYGPGGSPGRFLTIEEQMRELEILELASLRWLLNLVQGASIDESTVKAEIAAFIKPHQDESAAKSCPASGDEALQFVSQFVGDLKQFIEKRGTGIKWKIPIGEVSKVLSWEDILVGGSLYRAADWRSAFLLWAAELIERYGNRIRQCAYSDCGRLFVRDPVGRQKFCSPKCGVAERERRFRAKHPDWTEYRRRGRQLREEARERKERWQAKQAGLKAGKERKS